MIETSRIKDEWPNSFLRTEQLVMFDRAVMAYKIMNRLCPENLWNKFQQRSHYSSYNTRFCRDLQIPRYDLEYAKKGFSYSALKVWNEIPIEIRELPTLGQFKKQLKTYLMSSKPNKTRLPGRSAMRLALSIFLFLCNIINETLFFVS